MNQSSLVDLVNEWGTRPRAVAGESGAGYPDPMWLDLAIPSSYARRLSDRALARLADRLHPVFAASGMRERARLVTELLASSGVRPVSVAADGETARAAWAVDTAKHAATAAAALALRDHLDRLGVCTGRNCADVFVDTSPTHDRRFCSVTCQNRARVAAFRRRARTAAAGSKDGRATSTEGDQ
jgi:predicted RNA-binding Zn ribbon-like protein